MFQEAPSPVFEHNFVVSFYPDCRHKPLNIPSICIFTLDIILNVLSSLQAWCDTIASCKHVTYMCCEYSSESFPPGSSHWMLYDMWLYICVVNSMSEIVSPPGFTCLQTESSILYIYYCIFMLDYNLKCLHLDLVCGVCSAAVTGSLIKHYCLQLWCYHTISFMLFTKETS